MEDPKEYIQRQIFVAGKRARISAIQYYDEEYTACPFCGEKQDQSMVDGRYVLKCSANCKGYQEELKLLDMEASIRAEIAEATERLNAIRRKIDNNAMTAGTKIAAKHYMDLAQKRADFDKEIEELTK